MILLKTKGQKCHPCFVSNRPNVGGLDITTNSLSTTTATATITRRQQQSSTLLRDSSAPIDVIGTSDIVYGTLIALVLAFTASYLQGRRNTNDFVLATSQISNTTLTSSSSSNNVVDDGDGDGDSSLSNNNSTTTFDADSWKEMSQPESYIFYKQKLRERKSKSSSSSESPFRSENALVLFALLALFVPIFSIEFFFALSRQLICGGDLMNQSDLSEFLCSPAIMN